MTAIRGKSNFDVSIHIIFMGLISKCKELMLSKPTLILYIKKADNIVQNENEK